MNTNFKISKELIIFLSYHNQYRNFVKQIVQSKEDYNGAVIEDLEQVPNINIPEDVLTDFKRSNKIRKEIEREADIIKQQIINKELEKS